MKILSNIIPLLFIVLFVGCQKGVTIKEVTDSPRKYEGKIITIKGKVENTFSLFLIKYFELSDVSGARIRVITKRTLPKEGEFVSVRWKVSESFTIGNENVTMFFEDERDNMD